MALMKCPECGKEVSSKATACPNCGFDVKHRHWYSKKWGHYLILIIIIIIALYCYKFFNNTKGLVKEIDEKTKNEYIIDTELEDIKSKYNDLSTIEKMFVYNYSKVKNIKMKITNNNLINYLNIDISFNNYKFDESKSFLGIKKYTETANIKVNIKSNGKYEFENMEFDLDMNNGYKINDENLHVKLDKKGNFKYSGEVTNKSVLNNSLTSNLEEPSIEKNSLSFKKISGYIIIK